MATPGAEGRWLRGLRVPRNIDLQGGFLCIQVHNQRLTAVIDLEIHVDCLGVKGRHALTALIVEFDCDDGIQQSGPAPPAVGRSGRICKTTVWAGQTHISNRGRHRSR